MPIHSPRLTLGKPVVVSRAPLGLKHWGPWQFPKIERLADGRLHVSFHIEADSAKAYGLPVGHAVSSDDGKTWQAVPNAPAGGGLLLPNCDRLTSEPLRSLPVADLALPKPIATRKGTYGSTYDIYMLEDLPAKLRDGWHFSRCRAGQDTWVEEVATVRLPGEIRYTAEGVFTFPWLWRMCLAPDGSIWGMTYPWRAPNRTLRELWLPVFMRSTDNGHTWDLQSEIAYHGDPAADPVWNKRDGFTEPMVAFLPGGSMLALLRTTDGMGIGPLYICYSHDGGKTWSTPEVFDNLGVWPTLVTLKNGVTLAAYGRPGLFLRATADPEGRSWADRVAVVKPGERHKDTCSYPDLLVTGDNSALLVYSDFNYPDDQGALRKAILVRTVTVAA
jgi:BNR repeat-like domain